MKNSFFIIFSLSLILITGCRSPNSGAALKPDVGKNTFKTLSLYRSFGTVTDEQIISAMNEANDLISERGYPHSGFSFWKVYQDRETGYQYLFEGNWPSMEVYFALQQDKELTALVDKYESLFEQNPGENVQFRFERLE